MTDCHYLQLDFLFNKKLHHLSDFGQVNLFGVLEFECIYKLVNEF